jgi:hypothetical protein
VAERCGRPFSLDTENGDLHVAVTNPAPDLPIHLRQGDDLYTNSIVVLDVHTGKLRWYRQLVPNDSHDWDVTHATPMFSTTVGSSIDTTTFMAPQSRSSMFPPGAGSNATRAGGLLRFYNPEGCSNPELLFPTACARPGV